ncbi:hypothetical protein BC832DRAFT_274640 [Gaertneriomyces semiglobifer]|nr:hypothetical protein BC832DRAFT_274640 [Gaertneriomyces semiglobifer]
MPSQHPSLGPLLSHLPKLDHFHALTTTPSSPCAGIRTFELSNNVTLPDDLKLWLQGGDGCGLTWKVRMLSRKAKWNIARGRSPEDHVIIEIGRIQINGLRTIEDSCVEEPDGCGKWGKVSVRFSIEQTVFGTVWLVYPPFPSDAPGWSAERLGTDSDSDCLCSCSSTPKNRPHGNDRTGPRIYFAPRNADKLYPLIPTFTAYFQLALLHLGVHGWQLLYMPSEDLHALGINIQPTLDWLALYAPERVKIFRSMRVRELYKGNMSTETASAEAFDRDKLTELLKSKKIGAMKRGKP